MIMKRLWEKFHTNRLLSDSHSFILVGTSPVGIDMTPGYDTKAEIWFSSHLSSWLLFPGLNPLDRKEEEKAKTEIILKIFFHQFVQCSNRVFRCQYLSIYFFLERSNVLAIDMKMLIFSEILQLYTSQVPFPWARVKIGPSEKRLWICSKRK